MYILNVWTEEGLAFTEYFESEEVAEDYGSAVVDEINAETESDGAWYEVTFEEDIG